MKNYISIDIGGTAIKYGIIDEAGRIIKKDQAPTEAWNGGMFIQNKVIQIAELLTRETVISGICISTAGMVDTEAGKIFYAGPSIPEYTGICYKDVLEERFQVPCEVENDVNCAGLAECVSGAGKGKNIALCLTIGTGIGGSIIIDGKVFHGASNSACEVGYMSMLESDFQTLGASSILAKKVAQRKGESGECWNGKRIFEEAKSGDRICRQAIEEMVDVLGKGIANICYVMNPQIVILGGGIMAQEAYLYQPIRNAIDRHLVYSIAAHTELAFAKHQNDAGMLGAFYHYCQKQGIS